MAYTTYESIIGLVVLTGLPLIGFLLGRYFTTERLNDETSRSSEIDDIFKQIEDNHSMCNEGLTDLERNVDDQVESLRTSFIEDAEKAAEKASRTVDEHVRGLYERIENLDRRTPDTAVA